MHVVGDRGTGASRGVWSWPWSLLALGGSVVAPSARVRPARATELIGAGRRAEALVAGQVSGSTRNFRPDCRKLPPPGSASAWSIDRIGAPKTAILADREHDPASVLAYRLVVADQVSANLMTTRGMPSDTESVSATLRNPAPSNSGLVPT